MHRIFCVHLGRRNLYHGKNIQSGNACSECVKGKCLKTYDVSLLKGEINNEQSYLIVKRKILTYVIYFSSSAHLPLPVCRKRGCHGNKFDTKDLWEYSVRN